MNRRHLLSTVGLGVVAGLSGCGELQSENETTASRVSSNLVADDRERTADYPHAIVVTNDRKRETAVTVVVTQAETIRYRRTHRIAGETERAVAGFVNETLPEGEREINVCIDARGESECLDFRVDSCRGDIYATVGRNSLELTYSVC
jgi:hypothetical protein